MGSENGEDFLQQMCSFIESDSVESIKKLFLATPPRKVNELINKPNESCGGMSLLHFSVGFSSNDVKIVKLLWEHGADPNNTNCDERVSPLHLSILYEFDVVLDFLLKHGGDALLADGEGNNCFDLAEKQKETDLLKTVLLRHGSSFCGSLSSISSTESSTSSSGETTGSSTNTFFTCETSTSSNGGHGRTGAWSCLFTDDEEEQSLEQRGKRFGQLSTIREETSSLMKKFSPPPTATSKLFFVPESPTPKNDYDNNEEKNTTVKFTPNGSIPTFQPKSTPNGSLPTFQLKSTPNGSMPTLQQCYRPLTPLTLYSNNNNIMSSARESTSESSSGSTLPSPTTSEMASLELKMADLKVPVTNTTYRTLLKFVDPTTNKMVLTETENLYSLELQGAIRHIDLIHEYGNLKVNLLHNELESPRAAKSFYNYVLLDPRIIKRINFSGHQLKSNVILDVEKFRKFISAVFYIGKGSGIRPLQHLVDAKIALTTKQRCPSVKIVKILEIWKTGQGVIVQSFDHHSKEREASVNEAAMIDAMGVKDLSNIRKGSYVGTQASKWTQKQKNQFGVFLLHKCFSLYAVNGGKEFFPHDI